MVVGFEVEDWLVFVGLVVEVGDCVCDCFGIGFVGVG